MSVHTCGYIVDSYLKLGLIWESNARDNSIEIGALNSHDRHAWTKMIVSYRYTYRI
jgi:hypothetical protein